ncbi:MAG TPA: glycoside hydrolase family 3 C-terminal domain-containing protein [Kineosporiaceae bacterium]|nr:glycoside hydrolase family 3 C-terminal domain-containing protein [Kineosporiaceae bacterium]
MTVDARRTAADYLALVSRLDLPAKVRLLTGASAFTLAPEPAIGLRELVLSDGPAGVRGLQFVGGRRVALFPNATLLSSSWSEDSAYEVGRLLAEEARAQGVHVVLGPTVNLHRTLLGGRLFEAFSEDPLLTGRLAAAYVRGLQDSGVAAAPKHLVANESETERTSVNSVVDEATLRELYLLPFEIAVAQARPWTVMAAYNDVNGVPATEQHHVIVDILKGEWGWDGLLMSDWYATKSAAPAANAGLDLVMPGPDGPWGDALVAAVRAGEVTEDTVDEHLVRLLRLADRVGALGPPGPAPAGADLPAPGSPVRREQLTRLAASGMTVLTNRDVLPLSRRGRVALIGRHAVETVCMGGGSARVNPPYQVSIADGLRALLGDAMTVTDGVEVHRRPAAARPGTVTDPRTGEPGVRFRLLAADGALLSERVGLDATTLVGFTEEHPRPVATVQLAARLVSGGRLQVGTFGIGDWELTVGGRTTGYRLAATGTGIGAELIAPPLHVLVEEFAAGDVVEAQVRLPAGEGPLGGAGIFGLIAGPAPGDPLELIARAAAAAARADVAVVAVGLTEQEETESVDKTTLRLSGHQDELVRAVAAAARRTVVVVNAATPVLMPWRDDVDAVLWAGLPGQEGGHAVAAALLGDLEPAGRLVTTFPVADTAAPAWSVTPVNGRLRYAERTFTGYRGHATGRVPQPAFWFGHGLGYGHWEYTAARLEEGEAGRGPAVVVRVRNTGARDSREVVQVYLRPAEPDQPVRLVGWQPVGVPAGGEAEVRVVTEPMLWRRWDGTGWSRLSGGGELLLARGLGDVRVRLPLPTPADART